MLDQVESANDFVKDFAPLTQDMVEQAILMLSDMEQKGYFGFVRQGQYVMDQIVTSFTEDDVRQLGDNVVLILNTVKALTQPEMMDLVNSLTSGFQESKEMPRNCRPPCSVCCVRCEILRCAVVWPSPCRC